MNINQFEQADRDQEIVEDIDVRKMSRDQVSRKHNLSKARIAQIYYKEKSKGVLHNIPVDEILMMRVADLPLTFRFRDTIGKAYGYNVRCGDINDKSDSELLIMPNFGRGTLQEWRDFQSNYGLIKSPEKPQYNEELIEMVNLIRQKSFDEIDSILNRLKVLGNVIHAACDEIEAKCR